MLDGSARNFCTMLLLLLCVLLLLMMRQWQGRSLSGMRSGRKRDGRKVVEGVDGLRVSTERRERRERLLLLSAGLLCAAVVARVLRGLLSEQGDLGVQVLLVRDELREVHLLRCREARKRQEWRGTGLSRRCRRDCGRWRG